MNLDIQSDSCWLYGIRGISTDGGFWILKWSNLQLQMCSNQDITHQITAITPGTPGFKLSVTPSPPFDISSHNSPVNITVTIQGPLLGYNGNLTITFATS